MPEDSVKRYIYFSHEVWRPVRDCPGYEVSSLGRVRSWLVNAGPKRRVIGDAWSILKGIDNGSGYPKVGITDSNGKIKRFYVHRLVMSAFVGDCPKGKEVCHNNGNPSDPRAVNLRYDTRKANQKDSVRHGTYSAPPKFAGSNHPQFKFTEVDREIARCCLAVGAPTRLTAKACGMSQRTVMKIKENELKKNPR